MIKIGITGPESTGKSTLAHQLANHFDAVLEKEYARAFLEEKKGYNQSDLDIIAKKQWHLMHEEHENQSLMIIDTEMTVMKIWSQFKYNSVSPLIDELYAKQDLDHYFLCDIDLPWQEDPLREHPNHRKELFSMYYEELKKYDRPFSLISGSETDRKQKAIDIIRSLR